jgi:predicted nucleotidyltransferase
LAKAIHNSLPRQVRDRDVIHDIDGRVFVTLGHIQPQDRILSFLKYIPDPEGDWCSGKTKYKRVFWGDVDSVALGMSLVPPSYLIDDLHFGTRLLELPRQAVGKYFSPELRLEEIMHEGPSDELEAGAKHLAEVIHDTLGIPYERIGITGSISWKAHNPGHSDINMNVYGFKESWLLQEGYDEIVEQNICTHLREVTDRGSVVPRLAERLPDLPSTSLELMLRRRRELCVDERCIGVMPVLLPTQAPIQHGSEHYTSISEAPLTVNMEIEDVKYGIFMPAIYEGTSKPTKATQGVIVTRIMVYDGTFRGLLQPGDRVEVTGVLQKVRPDSKGHGRTKEESYQIMVGTKNGFGNEFIRLVEPSV